MNRNSSFTNANQVTGGKFRKFIWVFWDPIKYKNENKWHLWAFIMWALAILFLLLFVLICLLAAYGILHMTAVSGTSDVPWTNWPTALACLAFICALVGFSFKMSERKIRKIRLYDAKAAKEHKVGF